MTFENEKKFVLKNDTGLEDELSKFLRPDFIQQVYLSSDVRIRCFKSSEKEIFTFTFKKKIRTDTRRYVEIEQYIDKEVFDALYWEREQELTKYRYKIEHSGCNWDIDFFVDSNGTYFTMAECEMPNHWDFPNEIPDILSDKIIYEVPDNEQSMYSSRKLSDVRWAKYLMDSIHKKQSYKPILISKYRF